MRHASTASRSAVAAIAGILLSLSGPSEAQEFGIPGFGNLTAFGTANAGVFVEDGKLGIPTKGDTEVQIQNVNSLVGADWRWDVGYSQILLGHFEYGGDFVAVDETFDRGRTHQAYGGLSNGLGTLTFGRQLVSFARFYSSFVNRSQEIYATGITTPNAGGVKFSSNLLHVSSSVGRFEFGGDYQPRSLGSSIADRERLALGARYLQLFGRISFGGVLDRSEVDSGEEKYRVGIAGQYASEQWLIAAGVHNVNDASADTTQSYNLLGIIQLTPDDVLHLSLSHIEDGDVYDRNFGAGFLVEHRFGSRLSIYAEGAATSSEPASGGDTALNSALIVGVRFEFGNVWY